MIKEEFCTGCGNKLGKESRFCTTCGKAVETTNSHSKDKEDITTNEKSFVLNTNQSLKGLGGWLIVVCLGLVFTLVTSVITVFSDIKSFFDGTVEQASSIQGFSAFLGIELLLYLALAIFTIYLISLFRNRKKAFPQMYIIFLVAVVAISLVEISAFSLMEYPSEIAEVMKEGLGESQQGLAKGIIGGLVWGLYMKKSKRVNLTFVE